MADCKNALVEALRRHGEGGRGHPQEGARQGRGARRSRRDRGRGAARGSRPTASTASSSRSTARPTSSSRGDEFKGFVEERRSSVASKAPKGTDLGTQKYPGSDKTVDAVRQELVAKTGENIVVRRWERARGQGAGRHRPLLRPHGRQARGARCSAEAPTAEAPKNPSFRTFVDNCAMQVAAMNPIRRPQGRGAGGRSSTSRRRSSRPSSRKRASPSRLAEDHRGQGRQVVHRDHPPRPGQRLGSGQGDHRQAPPGARPRSSAAR